MIKLLALFLTLIFLLVPAHRDEETSSGGEAVNSNAVEFQSEAPAAASTQTSEPMQTPVPAAAPTDGPESAVTAEPPAQERSTEGDENETSMMTDF